jgi:hypothetical protein
VSVNESRDLRRDRFPVRMADRRECGRASSGITVTQYNDLMISCRKLCSEDRSVRPLRSRYS